MNKLLWIDLKRACSKTFTDRHLWFKSLETSDFESEADAVRCPIHNPFFFFFSISMHTDSTFLCQITISLSLEPNFPMILAAQKYRKLPFPPCWYQPSINDWWELKPSFLSWVLTYVLGLLRRTELQLSTVVTHSYTPYLEPLPCLCFLGPHPK